MNKARGKARDARRKEDLHQIQLALEMYYDDNGTYPPVTGWVYSTAGGEWISGLGAYMAKIPVDPKNNANNPWTTGNYSYSYGWNVGAGVCPGYPAGDCSGQTYDLVAQLENTDDEDRCYKKCCLSALLEQENPGVIPAQIAEAQKTTASIYMPHINLL